uniref:Uncharacterized protein n=1 Tax=Glossina pallidipes TaxID=7398 RepID=A0A1B0ACA4_GLOPL
MENDCHSPHKKSSDRECRMSYEPIINFASNSRTKTIKGMKMKLTLIADNTHINGVRSGQKINIHTNNIPNKYCENTNKSLTNAIITGHGVSCCLSWKSTLALTTTIAKRKPETLGCSSILLKYDAAKN